MNQTSSGTHPGSAARLIVLDRDGVINFDSDEYIKTPDEWRAIPGSPEAIAQLNKLGYRVVVATNQSGIARGLYSLEQLAAIHDKMQHTVREAGGAIEAIFFCPHGPDDDCECRKPRPGLLRQIEAAFGVSLTDSIYVGDSLRDLQAARAVGARPVLVRTGYGEATLSALPQAFSDIEVFNNLAAFVASLKT